MESQTSTQVETFRIGPFVAPRIWTGLWQLSSNAWGSASVTKIRQGMARHAELGYTAFGTCVVLQRHRLLLIGMQIWCVSPPYAPTLLTIICRLCCAGIYCPG